MVDVSKLIAACAKLFPASKVGEFAPYWAEVFLYAGIDTPVRAAMFLGQVGVECNGFRTFVENLNYSAPRLIQVWPNRFRMPEKGEDKNAEILPDSKRNALRYAYNSVKLASYVYGGRMGNRNEASLDGYRFRGRGPKQITGANNYVLFTKELGDFLNDDFIKNPDALLLPRIGLYAAGWFWKSSNLSVYADQENVTHVTRIVNGGLNKLKERTVLFQEAKKFLTNNIS